LIVLLLLLLQISNVFGWDYGVASARM